MAYAILRTTKIKSHGDVTGSISHAERTRETKNADPEKLQDNVTYVKFDADKFYNDVEASRTVKPPVDPKNPTAEELRNANVIAIEMLLTASPEYFEGKSREDIIKWADDNVKFAGQKFGEDNIRNAILHLDEKTPHVTLMIIPLKEHGLSCKSWLGEKSDMRKMQTEYAEAMKPYGLKRGEKGSVAEHETIQEYYTKLEQIKTEVLTLNPSVKVEVTPDQLREPTFKDKMNTTEYKAEVIKDTVAIMQGSIDKLTDQNKKLTAKLLTAENTIDRQNKELTKHRATASKNIDDLKEYGELKQIIAKPAVAEAIHLEENPHIKIFRNLKAEGLEDKEIAHKMLKDHKFTKERTYEAMMSDNGFGYSINKIVEETAVVVDKELVAEAQAKTQAEQEQARMAVVREEQIRIGRRAEYISKNPHIKKYLNLASKGMSDEAIAGTMLREGFNPKDVKTAIATETPTGPKKSNEADKYADKIVSATMKSIASTKGKGGGMVRGSGGGGGTMSRDKGLPLKLDLGDGKAVALNARTRDDKEIDWDALTPDQIATEIAKLNAEKD